MPAIEWQATAILSDVNPGVAPSTTRDITNSFNGEGSSELSLTFEPVGGSSPVIEVELYVWTGNQYVKTGDIYELEPGEHNFVEFKGGFYLAVEGTPTGSPTSYEVLIGRRPTT
jgi:hypothetical protein